MAQCNCLTVISTNHIPIKACTYYVRARRVFRVSILMPLSTAYVHICAKDTHDMGRDNTPWSWEVWSVYWP